MGVERTDYLMWGAKVDPESVVYEKHEAEMNFEDGRRFDLVRDNMSGEYAVAGRVVCESAPHEGLIFKEIREDDLGFDKEEVREKVQAEFADATEFFLMLFSHYH